MFNTSSSIVQCSSRATRHKKTGRIRELTLEWYQHYCYTAFLSSVTSTNCFYIWVNSSPRHSSASLVTKCMNNLLYQLFSVIFSDNKKIGCIGKPSALKKNLIYSHAHWNKLEWYNNLTVQTENVVMYITHNDRKWGCLYPEILCVYMIKNKPDLIYFPFSQTASVSLKQPTLFSYYLRKLFAMTLKCHGT